jgi:hypothetical protein
MVHGTKKEIIASAHQNGAMTDNQAEILCRKSEGKSLSLPGFTSITDQQAESLSRFSQLQLNGLASITDEQAHGLSKVEVLFISNSCQPLIDKFKKQ